MALITTGSFPKALRPSKPKKVKVPKVPKVPRTSKAAVKPPRATTGKKTKPGGFSIL